MNKILFMINLTLFLFVVPCMTLSAAYSPYESFKQIPPSEPDRPANVPMQNPTYIPSYIHPPQGQQQ